MLTARSNLWMHFGEGELCAQDLELVGQPIYGLSRYSQRNLTTGAISDLEANRNHLRNRDQ